HVGCRDLHSFPTRRSSDLGPHVPVELEVRPRGFGAAVAARLGPWRGARRPAPGLRAAAGDPDARPAAVRATPVNSAAAASPGSQDRKSTRLNSSHVSTSYA